MKACDQIRSVLLTDYIDGELSNGTKKDIDEHLLACPECRKFVAMAKEDMSALSDKGAIEKAPSHLWHAILRRIKEEEKPQNAIAGLMQRVAERFTMYRLAPALAGMVLLVLSTYFFLYTQPIGQGYGNEGLSYVSEVFTSEGVLAATEHEGLGTPIEEYFL